MVLGQQGNWMSTLQGLQVSLFLKTKTDSKESTDRVHDKTAQRLEENQSGPL